jgi:cytochrome P450
MLLAATSDESDRGMDDKQLRDESVTLLLAGHETTALAVTFAFHLLGTHPAVLARLRQEIDDTLGDRRATAADLPRLRYADAIIRESMRLYPPVWAIGREAVAPCRIGGQEIRPGTQLCAAQWVVHRDPRWFPEPESFRPERWENDFAKKLPRHAYFPFGGGPRICIGNAYAVMEAVLILVTIARRFSLAPADRKPLRLMPSVTIRPKGGVRMIVSRRKV